jgi:hypothetical protein
VIPFFVVDRPISLEIIKGLKIPRGQKMGLMAHANTSANFRKAFRDFPRANTVKMCDSAIFHTNRFMRGHDDLFQRYQEMGADYGVIIDILGNAKATIKSAKLALTAYDEENHKFELVAVAQGKTVEEYLECYAELSEQGFDHIAVGGLLEKRERSARYMNVRDKSLMEDVLKGIREQFDPKWLFVLGCLHPSRLELFKDLGVWGDYKGWIFEYAKRDESLKEGLQKLSSNHLAHAPARMTKSPACLRLKQELEEREHQHAARDTAREKMFKAKRKVQDFVSEMHAITVGRKVINSAVIGNLSSRGLLSRSDQQAISGVLKEAHLPDSFSQQLKTLADKSRRATKSVHRANKKLDDANVALLAGLERVIEDRSTTPDIKRLARKLKSILRTSEQTHRIKQVRSYIENNIFRQL